MRDQRALPQQRPMIAKERASAPPTPPAPRARPQNPDCASGVPPAATRARSDVHAPSQSSASASRSLALLARPRLDARGQRDRRQRPGLRERRQEPRRAPACHAGSASASASKRRAARLREHGRQARRRPARASHCSAAAGVGPRRRQTAGSGCAASRAPARAGARRGSGTSPAAAPRASSAARWPPAAFIASAGTITATLARPRWLVSCAQSGQRADALDADFGDRLDVAVVVDLEELEQLEVGMLARRDEAAARARAAAQTVVARRFAQQRRARD